MTVNSGASYETMFVDRKEGIRQRELLVFFIVD